MAKLFPSLEHIDSLKVESTDAERKLLYFLNSVLDDTYEVYFHPYINGDNPDVIILRESSGVMIIEVEDWDLNNCELKEDGNWLLKNVDGSFGEEQTIKSPLQKVFEYKENLYNLHIETLLEKKIKNPKYFSIVTCAVYFHNASKSQIDRFLNSGDCGNKRDLNFTSHFEILGTDSLTKENFLRIISKNWLDKKSYFFDEKLYKEFKRYLVPPIHTAEKGIEIIYTDEQKRIIESKANSQQKIKGVAGSGKTIALARRAVNAHLRHKGRVLILTFNISLRNYIRDRINEIRENFEWKYFLIIHYHEFISSAANNLDIPFPNIDKIDENQIPGYAKFQTILIDEVQDYERTWILNVRKFLLKDGEFVVFGDEKQNIYQRPLEDKKPYTSIPGQWNILKKTFRATNDISNLASQFQRHFFTGKYDYDEIEIQRSLFDTSLIKYYYLATRDISVILDIYSTIINETNAHENDVCFLSSKVEILRLIDRDIRHILKKNTKTMFETQEMYEDLKNTYKNRLIKNAVPLLDDLFIAIKELNELVSINNIVELNLKIADIINILNKFNDLVTEFHLNKLYKEIEDVLKKLDELKALTTGRMMKMLDKMISNIFDMLNEFRHFIKFEEENFKKQLEDFRRNKKLHFFMNTGTIKLSTIHSFKGWEIPTLFLIIEDESDNKNQFTTDELIYTAFTRCRQNLIIINLGNKRYDDFFSHVINNKNYYH